MNVQTVRLIDILLIAPFLIFVGVYYKIPLKIKIILIAIGLLTFAYNLNNYLINK